MQHRAFDLLYISDMHAHIVGGIGASNPVLIPILDTGIGLTLTPANQHQCSCFKADEKENAERLANVD